MLPMPAYLCQGRVLYRLLRELTVFSVLYDTMLVSLDVKLRLYIKEPVSGTSSVVEEVILEVIVISSNKFFGSYTRGLASMLGESREMGSDAAVSETALPLTNASSSMSVMTLT